MTQANTAPYALEYRRNFNIGDFESCSMVTVVHVFSADKKAILIAQIDLIEQALELFKYRKTAAKQAFNNKLADFCERQETQLMKEKSEIEKELPSMKAGITSFAQNQGLQEIRTVDSSAPVEFSTTNS
jgi:hypothetical protein